MQAILNKLNNSAALFGMRFTPPKCQVLLQDWVGLNPNLLAGDLMNVVDHFDYRCILFSPGDLAKEEVTQHIAKARAAFANLGHLWRLRDIILSIKGRVYSTAVRPILLYESDMASAC